MPPSLRVSVWSWLGSFAAGAVALLGAARDLDRLRLQLSTSARGQDPAASTELVDSSVTALLRGLFVGTGGLIAVSAASLVLLLCRRSLARWLLTVSGLLTVVTLLVAQALVAGGPEVDRVGFLVQTALLLLAVPTMLLRSSRSWFAHPRH